LLELLWELSTLLIKKIGANANATIKKAAPAMQ